MLFERNYKILIRSTKPKQKYTILVLLNKGIGVSPKNVARVTVPMYAGYAARFRKEWETNTCTYLHVYILFYLAGKIARNRHDGFIHFIRNETGKRHWRLIALACCRSIVWKQSIRLKKIEAAEGRRGCIRQH